MSGVGGFGGSKQKDQRMTMRNIPIIRRLSLLTLLSALGGALFVPFMVAGSAPLNQRELLYMWTLTPLACAVIGSLCAWGGLVAADRAELPMPILRTWELGRPQDRSQWLRIVIFSVIGGAAFAGLTLLCAGAIPAMPKNPGDLAARLMTIPFAAVVTEVLAHLLILSALALWLGKRWLAILLSSAVFTIIFHGQSYGSVAITIFALAFNFTFSTFSGWAYTRFGFVSAMLLHAVAHGIVLGFNV